MRQIGEIAREVLEQARVRQDKGARSNVVWVDFTAGHVQRPFHPEVGHEAQILVLSEVATKPKGRRRTA